MKITMITLIVALIAGTSLLMSYNRADTTASVTSTEIPPLLKKHDMVGDLTEAESILTAYDKALRQIEQNPENQKPRLDLARIFTIEARLTGEHGYYYPAAMVQIDHVLENTSDENVRYDALYLKAGVQLSQHHFSDALETAQQGLAINTTHAGMYGTLVDAYTELGQYDQALENCDKMLALRPDLRSYSRASYLRELHGDMKGAVEAMEAAVEAGYPGQEDRAWAAVQLAELYNSTDGYQKAKLCNEKILEERENYPFAIAALARLELQEKNYVEAESLFKKAAAIIPEVSFYEGLCKVYSEAGQAEKAAALFEEIKIMYAEDIATGHSMNLDLAKATFELGNDPEEAYALLESEIKERPENKDVALLAGQLENAIAKKN